MCPGRSAPSDSLGVNQSACCITCKLLKQCRALHRRRTAGPGPDGQWLCATCDTYPHTPPHTHTRHTVNQHLIREPARPAGLVKVYVLGHTHTNARSWLTRLPPARHSAFPVGMCACVCMWCVHVCMCGCIFERLEFIAPNGWRQLHGHGPASGGILTVSRSLCERRSPAISRRPGEHRKR